MNNFLCESALKPPRSSPCNFTKDTSLQTVIEIVRGLYWIQWPANLPVLMEHSGKCVRRVSQSGSQSCCDIETEKRCPSGAVWIKPNSLMFLFLCLSHPLSFLSPHSLSLSCFFLCFISLIMLKCFSLDKCWILMLYDFKCLLVPSPSRFFFLCVWFYSLLGM